MSVVLISQYFGVAAAVVAALWAIRLKRLGLVHHYPLLFSYLVFVTLYTVVAIAMYRLYDQNPRASVQTIYAWFWIVSQPLSWAFLFCVLVEIYDRLLADFKGFQRLGQLVLYGILGATGMLFLGLIFLQASVDTWQGFWMIQEQSVNIALLVVSLLLALLASVFRRPVPRNTQVVLAVFGIIFSVQAVLLGLENLYGGPFRSLRYLVITIVTLVAWSAGTLLFSKEGEEAPENADTLVFDSSMKRELAGRLQSFNDVLVRFLRP